MSAWPLNQLAARYNFLSIVYFQVGAEYIKLIWVPDTFFVNEKIALFHQVCCNLHAWNSCECVNCYIYMLHAWVKCQMCQMLYIQNFVTWRFDGKFSNHQPQLIGLWLGCNNCNGIPTKMSSNISLIVIVLTNDIVGYCYCFDQWYCWLLLLGGEILVDNNCHIGKRPPTKFDYFF